MSLPWWGILLIIVFIPIELALVYWIIEIMLRIVLFIVFGILYLDLKVLGVAFDKLDYIAEGISNFLYAIFNDEDTMLYKLAPELFKPVMKRLTAFITRLF